MKKPSVLVVSLLMFGLALIILSGTIVNEGQFAYTSGMLIMFCSLFLLVITLGNRWSTSLGVMHIAMLILYHGIATLFNWLFPYANFFALYGVESQGLATATLIAAGGIFSFTIGYIILEGHYKALDRNNTSSLSNQVQTPELSKISTTFLFVFCLAVLAYGAGGLYDLQSNSALNYWLDSFLVYLSVPMLLLYFLHLYSRIKNGTLRQSFALVQITLFIALTLLLGGERQAMLTLGVSFVVLGSKWKLIKLTPTLAILGIVGLLVLFSVVAIMRSVVGRATLRDTPIGVRVDSYQALTGENISKGFDNLLYDLSYRLNANVIVAALDKSISDTRNTLTVEQYIIPLNLVIPSALWDAKLELPSYMRSVKGYLVAHFELPQLDYLLTDVALFYATGGIIFLVVTMFLLGLTLAYLDRWLNHTRNMFGIVVGICATIALAWVEHDITVWFLYVRNAIIMYCILATFQFVRLVLSQRKVTLEKS